MYGNIRPVVRTYFNGRMRRNSELGSRSPQRRQALRRQVGGFCGSETAHCGKCSGGCPLRRQARARGVGVRGGGGVRCGEKRSGGERGGDKHGGGEGGRCEHFGDKRFGGKFGGSKRGFTRGRERGSAGTESAGEASGLPGAGAGAGARVSKSATAAASVA